MKGPAASFISLFVAAAAAPAVINEHEFKHARVVHDVLSQESLVRLRDHAGTLRLLRDGDGGSGRHRGTTVVEADDLSRVLRSVGDGREARDPVELRTTLVTRDTEPHLDGRVDSDGFGEDEETMLVFLNDNVGAYLRVGEDKIPAVAGTAVSFKGNSMVHNTVVPHGSDVRFLGPISTRDLAEVAVVMDPAPAPVIPGFEHLSEGCPRDGASEPYGGPFWGFCVDSANADCQSSSFTQSGITSIAECGTLCPLTSNFVALGVVTPYNDLGFGVFACACYYEGTPPASAEYPIAPFSIGAEPGAGPIASYVTSGASGCPSFSGTRHTYSAKPIAVCRDIILPATSSCASPKILASCVGGESSDPNGNELNLELSDYGPFPIGVTVITLTVDNGEGEASCSATITVVGDGACGPSSKGAKGKGRKSSKTSSGGDYCSIEDIEGALAFKPDVYGPARLDNSWGYRSLQENTALLSFNRPEGVHGGFGGSHGGSGVMEVGLCAARCTGTQPSECGWTYVGLTAIQTSLPASDVVTFVTSPFSRCWAKGAWPPADEDDACVEDAADASAEPFQLALKGEFSCDTGEAWVSGTNELGSGFGSMSVFKSLGKAVDLPLFGPGCLPPDWKAPGHMGKSDKLSHVDPIGVHVGEECFAPVWGAPIGGRRLG